MLKFRKMLAGLVGITMTANLLATMPYSAFADDSDSRTYTYEHYEVTYNVTNSWGGTDVVSVTLSNIGDTTIENWMLYFDPNGDIQYVNDATQAITSGGTAYIKNAGYNANVDANASVTFSYAVNDCEVAPDDFVLCQTRVEKESGYEVNLKVNESWGDSFNGEIILQNNTDAPIEAWELMIDTNFTITEITNSWAATVTELEPYSYLLKGTYTGTVYANSSVSLGFVGVKNGEPEIISDSLTEVVIDEDMINNVTYEDEFYDDCIDWSTVPDSDEDGLPDDLEEEYGCDPENPDTDGDGLPDGYEILTIGSNPADVHSLDSTLSDGEYDNDQDGLSNYEEYLLGTDPLLADSDFDGLSDGDEVALGLNPLVVDSNGDGVLDSKEKFSQSKSFDAKETDAVVQGVDVAFEGTGYIHSTTTVESVMDVD